ncbi:MAG: hypothetical protein U1E53_05620 [Dongiaceae bacterium]
MADGLITIAYGPRKYLRMARALALSYRRLGGRRPLAVVTDAAGAAALLGCYDLVIPVDPALGQGVVHKLHLDRYSPFDATLFVDSDCLFYKHPERLWRLYDRGEVSVRGWRYLTGDTDYERDAPYEWVVDMKKFLGAAGIARLPHFNSGALFFRRSDRAEALFATARAVYDRRHELGLRPFKNAPANDEPILGIAMERCGVALDPWDPEEGMETAIRMCEPVELDVLRGRACFRKDDGLRSPCLLHFNVDAQESLAYQREICRLELERARFAGDARVRLTAGARVALARLGKAARFARRVPGRVLAHGPAGLVPGRAAG